jgi:acyl carrier protein
VNQDREAVSVDSSEIRALVVAQAHLPLSSDSISDTTDLNGAGLNSVTRMNVIIAIEDHYSIQFPDEMLTKETFRNIQSISNAVKSLLARGQTAVLFIVSALLPDFPIPL